MKFTAAQDFTSLAELLRLYGDADEIVFKSHCRLDETEIAEACHEARLLAQRLRLRHNARSAEEIAASLGCRLLREAWEVGEGKIVYLAECLFPPKTNEATIRLNSDAVTSLAKLMAQWVSEAEKQWFTEAKISEVVVAHELFHVIERRPSSPLAELQAHAFARALTRLPFSPLLYQALLARLATGKKAARR
jgi:hypothetical protein